MVTLSNCWPIFQAKQFTFLSFLRTCHITSQRWRAIIHWNLEFHCSYSCKYYCMITVVHCSYCSYAFFLYIYWKKSWACCTRSATHNLWRKDQDRWMKVSGRTHASHQFQPASETFASTRGGSLMREGNFPEVKMKKKKNTIQIWILETVISIIIVIFFPFPQSHLFSGCSNGPAATKISVLEGSVITIFRLPRMAN